MGEVGTEEEYTMKLCYKITAGVALGSFLFITPAKAFFGEDIPFLIQLVNQSLQEYRLGQQAYSQAKRAGYYFTHLNVRNILFNSVNTATQNVYGETIQWPHAMDSGAGVEAAWSRATIGVQPAQWVANDLNAQAQLASIETLDSAAKRAIAVHGEALVQSNKLAGNLDNPSIQDGLQMQQVGNSTTQSLLELSIAQAKVTRDQIAQRVAFDKGVEEHSQGRQIGLGPQVKSLGWIPE